MDDNLAWCPVCDRQILPRFVQVNPLQPTAPVAKPETPPSEAGATIPLPPPVKATRPGLRKAKTATGRIKRVSPPKNNEQLRRISTQHNIANKTEKPAKKKVNRRRLVYPLLTILIFSCRETFPTHLTRPPQPDMRTHHPPKRPQRRNTPLPYRLRMAPHLLQKVLPPIG